MITIQFIDAAFEIFAGGPGSGPTSPCPQCGPHHGMLHTAEPGDIVKLLPGGIVRHSMGPKQDVPPGHKFKIVNVMPKIGSNDQKVTITPVKGIPKHLEKRYTYYADLHHLALVKKLDPDALGKLPAFTKPWFKDITVPSVKKEFGIKDVPMSKTIMKTTTNDGAKLTWVKPQVSQETTPKNLEEISREAHSLKGKFGLQSHTSTIPDIEGMNKYTKVYDTTKTPLESRSVSKGATVWVSPTTHGGKLKGISVREQNYTTHAQILSTLSFNYKNAAKAVGMLKQRYGINTSLNKLRIRGQATRG